jgi:hypothetical protein
LFAQREVEKPKIRAQPIGKLLKLTLFSIILNHLAFRLLKAAEEALIEGSNKHLEIVEEITKDHLNAAKAAIQNQEILLSLESQLKKECLKLRSFLEAAEVCVK